MGSAIYQPLRRLRRRPPVRASQHRRHSPRWTVSKRHCRRWDPRNPLSKQLWWRRSIQRRQSFRNRSTLNRKLQMLQHVALQLLGEDDPDAEPLKVALKQVRMHARVRPVGERLDLCLQYVARVKKQVARAEDQCEKQGKSLHRWRRSLRTGGFSSATTLPRAQHPTTRDGGGPERGSHQVESSGGRVAVGATSCSRGRFKSQEGKDSGVEFDICDARPWGEVVGRTLLLSCRV